MAEENVAANEAAQVSQPGVDELAAQVKALTEERDKAVAESRKWEGRSKSNAAAAKRLAELEDASKTDAEKLADAQKRAEEAEGLRWSRRTAYARLVVTFPPSFSLQFNCALYVVRHFFRLNEDDKWASTPCSIMPYRHSDLWGQFIRNLGIIHSYSWI